MRKITRKIAQAFLNGVTSQEGNTSTDGRTVLLHGHSIIRKAVLADGKEYIQFNNWGFEMATTKERLNGLLELIGLSGSHGIYQRDFEWFWKKGKLLTKRSKWFWKNGESFPSNQWVTVGELDHLFTKSVILNSTKENY